MTAPRFIVLEGGDGSGKSTQARLLAEHLGARLTREPGGTALGEKVRSLVLDVATGALDERAEALLLAAARAQHVAEIIRPALAAGEIVVCDRYVGSSIAYQGYGRGLAPDELRRLNDWATGALVPDLVVYLEVPGALAAERLGTQRDRFERVGDGFHRRVAEGYRALAAAQPMTWAVVDGTGSVEQVAARVRAAVGAVQGTGPPREPEP